MWKRVLILTIFISGIHGILSAQESLDDLVYKYTMEVYKGTEYTSPAHLLQNKEFIDRVHILEINEEPDFEYTNLSLIELKDKYNELTRDDKENFNPGNFNPLKYRFNFYHKDNSVYYRVDDTNFYIEVKVKSKSK